MTQAAFSLLVGQSTTHVEAIMPTLACIPTHLLERAAHVGTRIVVLGDRRYGDVSPVLRRLNAGGVDNWPVPPAGLFVVEERTVYLRSLSRMTISHEIFHAVDMALGDGVYLSGVCPQIRAAFERASAFVTPYAASGLDEYFAEAGRAMISANDPGSLWPRATQARLAAVDPAMFARMTQIFEVPQ